MTSLPRFRRDLLALLPLRLLVSWRCFPLLLQACSLIAMLWLVAAGFGVGAGGAAGNLMILRKTNLATLVVWGLWWPAMIALAVLLGRIWCSVCPMELVNRLSHAVGRSLGWSRSRLGRRLRAGWFVVTLYLVLQLLVAGFSIHRVPHYTAVFLSTLLGLALITGFVYREPRSFCRAFCPASAMLSVYSRFTPVQLEMRDSGVCADCTTRDCIAPANRHRFDKRSCPSLLLPYDRDPSSGCLLCLQCAKVCPHDNVGFGLVAGDAPIRRHLLLQPSEAVFVMIALGFVTHEVAGEVTWLDAAFHAVPSVLAGLVPSVPMGWWEAMWFLLLFPAMVWLLIAAGGYLAGYRGGLAPLLRAAATGAAPVVAITHLAKASAKFASWCGYLPLSCQDPRGLNTMRELTDGVLIAPPALLELPVVGWIMLLLAVVLFGTAWRDTARNAMAPLPALRAGFVGSAALFTAVMIVWSWPGR